MSPDIWAVLGIEPTQDVTAIRRAYAAALKRTRPEDDPAGFAQLRQVYEFALMLARAGAQKAAVSESDAVPESAPAAASGPDGTLVSAPVVALEPGDGPVSAPAAAPGPDAMPVPTPAAASVPAVAPAPQPAFSAVPAEVEHLRLAFQALRHAAMASPPTDPQTLQALLRACLTSPALEILTVQLEFEPVMVQFLLQTLPATQCLLEPVIQQWKWRERLHTRVGPGIATLLANADNLRALERLQKASPATRRALTDKPQPLWLWFNIVFFNLHRRVQKALGQFRPGTLDIFDPRALEWWTRFRTEPHLRPMLLRATVMLMLVGALWGGTKASWEYPGWVIVGMLGGAVVGLAIAGLWLEMVELARYRYRESRRKGASGLRRLGWAPASVAACFLATLGSGTLNDTFFALLLSRILLSWIIPVAPGFADFRVPPMKRVWALVVVNLPLLIWWVALMGDSTSAPTLPMSIVFAATLLAFALGQSLLWSAFLQGLSVEVRQRVRWVILGLALGALALARTTHPDPFGSRVLLMALVGITLAHRTPTGNLTLRQVKVVHYVCSVAFGFYLVPALVDDKSAAVLSLGGVVTMVGVVVRTALGIYNDRQSVRDEVPTIA